MNKTHFLLILNIFWKSWEILKNNVKCTKMVYVSPISFAWEWTPRVNKELKKKFSKFSKFIFFIAFWEKVQKCKVLNYFFFKIVKGKNLKFVGKISWKKSENILFPILRRFWTKNMQKMLLYENVQISSTAWENNTSTIMKTASRTIVTGQYYRIPYHKKIIRTT